MRIAIISIGNEILNGSIVDTNSNYIAKTLAANGYEAESIYALKDNIDEIKETFGCLSATYDVVITTGGLGPTFDDLTTEALSQAANKSLKLCKNAYFDVVRKVKSKNVRLKLSHLKQVYLPQGAEIIKNEHGTAPGISIKINKAHFFSLPGVPSEMKPMFENYVLPTISELFPAKKKYRYDLKLIGVAESDMDEFLSTIETKKVDIILNAQEGELAVRLFSFDKSRLEDIHRQIENRFALKLYSDKDEKIEDVVDAIMSEKKLKLGIIETFSGGYVTLLISNKERFGASIIKKSDNDVKNDIIKDADVVLFPNSLNGNRFVLNIYFKGELNQIYTKYMGNLNFMRKAAAKRTLGHLYEFLKNLDFL